MDCVDNALMFAEILILAQAASDGGSGVPEIPQPAAYGLLVVAVTALASGRFVVPRFVYDREKDRADRLESEKDELYKVSQNRTIPALVNSTNAVKEAGELVREVQRRIEREGQ